MFKAQIYNANRMEIGALEGKYRSARNWDGGFMSGRWKIRCSDRVITSDDSNSDGF